MVGHVSCQGLLMSTTQEIRIGFIGSGGIAGVHAERYKRVPWVHVVGVADVVPDRAQGFIDRYGFAGAQAFTDYREMLTMDLDAVDICTFNAAHYLPTMDALRAGKHVLLEKPMAVTLAEAVEMVRQSRRSNRMLTIGFQSRYAPETILARRIVSSGELGKVYYVESGGGRRHGIPGGSFVRRETAGGGAILDIGCYSIDTVMYALGNPRPLTVSAYTSGFFGTSPTYRSGGWGGTFHHTDFSVEDFGAAFIRLEGGITYSFRIAWAMHMESLGPTLFLGTEGGLNLSERRIFHDHDGVMAHTDLSAEGGSDQQLQKVESFARAVRGEIPNPLPGEDILHSEAMIDGIYRSAALGREVAIEIPAV